MGYVYFERKGVIMRILMILTVYCICICIYVFFLPITVYFVYKDDHPFWS